MLIIIRKLAMFLFMAAFISCSTQSQGFKIYITKTDDIVSRDPKYELVVCANNKIIARRVFQKGKTIIEEGNIPSDFINATTVKVIKDKDESMRGLIYLKNNKIIAERYLENDKVKSNGKIPDGIIIEKYENGNIKNIYVHKNSKKEGPVLGFHKDGQLKLEVFYVDGFPSGISKIYYENGDLMSEGEFINKQEMFHKEYNENGKLKAEWKIVNGKEIFISYP